MAKIINLSKMAISAIMASDIDEDDKENSKKTIYLLLMTTNEHQRCIVYVGEYG